MTEPLALTELPSDAEGWMSFVTTRPDVQLQIARALVGTLKDGTHRSSTEVLALWNDVSLAISTAESTPYLISESHPDEAIRAAASERYVAAAALSSELALDRELWSIFDALDADGLDEEQDRLLRHTLRNFRLSGVNLDDDGRARVQKLTDRDTELSLAFARNIREGRRSMTVAPEDLAGLPQDFIDAHPRDEDGRVTLTTDYPDLMPVKDYATVRETRLAITQLQGDLGWPHNDAVLAELLAVRAERASLLGMGDWADVETATRMAGSSARVAEFLDEVDDASRAAAEPEYEVLLERLRADVPDAEAVTTADFTYLLAAIKRERFGVDAQEVRSYFPFENVLAGVLDVTGRLLGLTYRSVDVPTWHTDVRAYDVYDGEERIGRIYLDLHPREGKYNHAACFSMVTGVAGRELPEASLLCNFSRGLMEHDEVTTFLHEFGHVVHAILAGRQRFVSQSGIATEWDFVEAPSQMLEEWAWDADVLATFARNAAGEPIPPALVERMRTADAFGRALGVRRQLGIARVSYHLHTDVPEDITTATAALLNSSTRVRTLPDTHFACGFGHLTGYGACYYTYQWSLVIARDLLTGFTSGLMGQDAARRYRDLVLTPGGTRDAAELVADFLGRPYGVQAYQSWLAGE